MSNGHELSGSGSNQSQTKIFPLGTGSSDSSSALTVENVKRLDEEYLASKEAFDKQRIQDYIEQTNLARFNKRTTRKTSTELAWNAEPEGASSPFPTKRRKNSKEVCWKISGEISRKNKLLTAPATDSLSAQPTGSKPKESKWRVDGSPASCCSRRTDVEDKMTQTEWSYSDESLAAREDANHQFCIHPSCGSQSYSLSSGNTDIAHQAIEVLSKDTEVYSEAGGSKGTAEIVEEVAAKDEENNQAGLCEQAAYEPVELAQGSPRLESDEELLSIGGKHEDDRIATDLYQDEETEESVKCTFCSAPEKPIPTVLELKEQPQENLFCCRRYKEMFDAIIQEQMSEDEAEEELDIAAHANPSQAKLRSSIKEKLLQQLDEGGFESYREIIQQYLKFVDWTRISFRLSKQNEYTVRPKTAPFKRHQPTSVPPEDLLELDRDFVAEHLKHCSSSEPVRQHYPDGQTFFLLFPNGSGQVYYPSGKVAILITFTKEDLFTYCILEDNWYAGIRAAFGSHGHGFCFHPDGQLWAALDPCTGICLDHAGSRQKRWNWHDFSHHTHSPPFQSITMKLNDHITIKILAQDQIHLSFTSRSNSIRFNAGSRLKLKDPETSHLLKCPESEEELFLQSKKIQLKNLLSKIETILQYFWQPLSQ